MGSFIGVSWMNSGILFSFKDHKITVVATDGRRLALMDEEADVNEENQGDFIVPTKAIAELNRLLQETGDVEITSTENRVAFKLKGTEGLSVDVITKLVEGNYPNYRQVIPAESGERIALGREEFLQSLRRAEIMTSEKQNSVCSPCSRQTTGCP